MYGLTGCRKTRSRVGPGLKSVLEKCKLQDSWWEPPHLWRGKECFSAPRNSLNSIMRFESRRDG